MSADHAYYITTPAMMHPLQSEQYVFHRCRDCESVFLTNRVEEDALSQYYTDKYLPYRGAQAWGKFHSFVEGSQKSLDHKRVRIVSGMMAGRKSSFSILDVGCGRPSFLRLAQQKLNVQCTGIDFSENGWKNEDYNSINLVKTLLLDFYPTQTYDVITLWHYLEHDYRLQETVAKLHSLLKPGGMLIIEVPDYQSATAKWQKHYWQGWHSPRHLTLISVKGFQRLFAKDRWTIQKHLRYGTLDAFTLWWLGRMEKKKINWWDSMEKEFWPLVILKVISFPLFLFEKVLPMGIQLIAIEKLKE
jgi:2-polyprenyl-3-methyl-5-hydroxy-6-metoxy-1,4-benzoquinol methylase